MGNNIVEENPTQQSSAPSGPQGQGAGGGQEKIRKQARQLAYDVRYKVKQGFKDGQKTDPASLKRAFMSQLGKSPAPGPVKQLAKKMLIGESYDFIDISETVEKSISNVVGKVFVKKIELDDANGNPAFEVTDLVQEASGERKYKVRVTDKKTGKSYTRMADRAKISELRKNPNISSVEMTGYGTPYEGEKKKGSATAAVKSGKGLAKKDFDGDGKVESPTAEYKGSRDKAIKKALHKEEFLDEITKDAEDANPQANTKKIDVMKGKNKIEVNPKLGEQVNPAAAEEKLKKDDDLAGAPNPKEDPKEKRVRLMKRQILQKKMQAVRSGAGADIVAHTELEGEVISEKEVKVRDTRRVIDAIRAYDKSKDASKDATADSDEGHPEKAAKERKYAKKERGEIDKDDPNWKKRKYHTGMHGESYTKEDAQYGYDSKGRSLNPDDKPLKDQDDKQIANVTFDGGGPDGGATIKGSGDSREIPTFVALIKNKLRARGILVSHNVPEGEMVDEANKGERVADPYRAGKLSARPVGKRASKKDSTTARLTADVGQRNRRRFDKRHGGDGSRKLNKFGSDYRVDKREGNSSESSDHAQKQRRAEHQARRGVKTKGVKEGYQRDPDRQEKDRKTSKQSDPSKAGFTGISGSIATIMKQNAAMKKAATKKEDLDTAKDIVRTILEKDLNAKERRALPDKDFALPGKGEGPEGKQAGSYPIPDKSHARMALAMVAKHGSAKEKAEVRAAVEKKFPGIKVGD